jgi:hypothetical protein
MARVDPEDVIDVEWLIAESVRRGLSGACKRLAPSL